MPVTLLYGDNEIELNDTVRTTRAGFNGADVLTYEGAVVPLATLSEACLTAGLFDPQRLVIVHGLHERMKGKSKEGAETEEIRRILMAVAPTTTLLLVSPGMDPEHPLANHVREAGGELRHLRIPRKNDLPRWVVDRGKQHNVAVQRDAASLLVDLVGNDTVFLDTELEKLATFAGEQAQITLAMVDALVGAVTQDSIFALVDAVAAGDGRQALQLLHIQLDAATTEPVDFALYLIRMLARQVRILLRIRLGQEAGRNPRQIASELRLPPYYTDRYLSQARRLSRLQLTAAFEQLAALEYALKQGKADATTGLDLLVTELCA
ncbi:MAG TPA: DNA polymerase III subunit delta [Chloroflexota bacterium]